MKSRIPILITGAFLVLGMVAIAALLVYTRAREPLPVLAKVPDFVMTDSQAQPFDSKTMLGKVWVADFFFTSCPGPCPIMGKNLQRISEKFVAKPLYMVSISVDPKNDVPEKLKRYAQKFKADTSRWFFLTAPEELVREVSMEGFKMGNEAIINHSPYFALVDRSGLIRGYYNGTVDEDVSQLIVDIRELLL